MMWSVRSRMGTDGHDGAQRNAPDGVSRPNLLLIDWFWGAVWGADRASIAPMMVPVGDPGSSRYGDIPPTPF